MRRLIPVIVLVAATPLLAVNTSHWVHTSEAEFKKGTFRNVVATNLGDLKLSRAVKTILEQDAKVSAVYALAEGPDGSVYAGTGPHGIVLRVKDDKVTRAYEPQDAMNVFSVLVDAKGRLLLGTGGEAGKILRIDDPTAEKSKAEEVFAEDGVQYVWAVRQTPDGNLYAATGPNGQLFEVKADGSKSVLLDSDENNLMSLISDGKDLLYAGTDPNGLVYRVNRKSKEVFVLFNAPEAEVAALALDAKGNLYAGTAEASEQQPAAPGAATAGAEKGGRPEGTGGVPIPGQPPEAPKPPPVPDPNPGEPDPIPKKAARNSTDPTGDGLAAGGHSVRGYLLVDEWRRILKLDDPSDPGDDDPSNPQPPPVPGPNPAPTPPPGKKPGPGKPAPVNAAGATPPTAPEPIDFGKPKPDGNAIYRIDGDGFVREIFRQPVMVLSLIERDGVLLVGTGSDGNVYQVDPAAEETVVLAKVDPKQVLAMLATKDGRIVLGMANVGGLATMSSGYAASGTFTSPVLDAAQISRFGKLHLNGSLPKGTSLTISTRSGNVQDPEKTGWSAWTAEASATTFHPVMSPSARFLQYRLTFASEAAKESAVVDQVDVAYQMPNLAPVIKSVKVGNENKLGNALAAGLEALAGVGATAKSAAKNTVEQIRWEAEDANGDGVQYSLYLRSAPKAPWILLKEKLTDTSHAWDTRTVGDGRYEIKVVASDAGANPAGQGRTGTRVSDPILIDNTAPAIGGLKAASQGGGVVVSAAVVDRTSTVASVEYSVDSGADWQAVLPSDNIFDSPEEKVQWTVSNLSPGAHQITVRAADAKGNFGYETVFVNIEAQAGK